MIVASSTNAFLHIIYALSNEPDTLDDLNIDNKTHTNGECVGANIARPSLLRETIYTLDSNGFLGPEEQTNAEREKPIDERG